MDSIIPIIIIVVIIAIIFALLYFFTDVFQVVKDLSTTDPNSRNYVKFVVTEYSNDVVRLTFYHQISEKVHNVLMMKNQPGQINLGLQDLLNDDVITVKQYDKAYSIALKNGWI